MITERFTNENAASAPKLIIDDTVVRLMKSAVSPNTPTTSVRHDRGAEGAVQPGEDGARQAAVAAHGEEDPRDARLAGHRAGERARHVDGGEERVQEVAADGRHDVGAGHVLAVDEDAQSGNARCPR